MRTRHPKVRDTPMAAGTAHIVFAGGSLTLPAQTPYDRQQLMDHVLGSARSKQQVQVRVDHTMWLIERSSSQHPVVCSICTRRIDHAVCRRPRGTAAAYCVACALARPRLSIALLSELPAGATLCDVQAHYAYGGEWVAWTRWPQATPAEIIDDMRLQRRFAPVLIWRCAEIRFLATSPGSGNAPPRRVSSPFARVTNGRWPARVAAGSPAGSPWGPLPRHRAVR